MASTIIEEYLAKIGFVTDKNGFNEVQNQLKQVQNQLNGLNFNSFLTGMARVMTALVGFELAAAAALVAFTKQVISADMQTQIFARRLMTTTENARSLKNVMSAMGLQSLEDLRDVALNPTLRKQFLGLRHYASGLEPGANVQAGLGNFRDVGYQIQKINVLLSYLSQYVVGYLGKILEGPLRKMAESLEYWATKGKESINQWASKIAYYLAYIERFAEGLWGLFKALIDIDKALNLDHWFMAIIDLLLFITFSLRDMLQFFAEVAKKFKIPAALLGGTVAGAAVGTAINPGVGTAIGAGLGLGTAIGGIMINKMATPHSDSKTTAAFKAFADQMADKYSIPRGLLRAQINQESGWNPNAKSTFRNPDGSIGHAYGISQFIPGTAKSHGVNALDPYSSIEGQAKWMGDLIHRYGVKEALSVYNSGRRFAYMDPHFAHGQTYNYVNRILGAASQYNSDKRPTTQNINIHINGAKDPKAVAKEVHGALSTRTLQGVGA